MAQLQSPAAPSEPAEPLSAQRKRPPELSPRGPVPPLPPFREPPGLAPPVGLLAREQRGELLVRERARRGDSSDEEAELLRGEAGVAISADEPLTDPELDAWGGNAVPSLYALHGDLPHDVPGAALEDEEEISSPDASAEVRSRLWAQSLLRLKRSIDEIYCLCEFESDEVLCQQVRVILETGSKDMEALMGRLDAQQEYTLLAGGYPFKSGVAWTTRTPKVRKRPPSLEQLEGVPLSSPQGTPAAHTDHDSELNGTPEARRNASARATQARPPGLEPPEQFCIASPASAAPAPASAATAPEIVAKAAGRAWLAHMGPESEPVSDGGRGLDPSPRSAWIVDAPHVTPPEPPPGLEDVDMKREEHFHFVVQSALQKVHSRLSRATGRPSPEELRRRCDDRQRRAQEKRASQDDRRMLQLQQAERRMLAARERRQEREERKRQELLEKMNRARRQYQDQLRIICERARRENQKTVEVAHLAKEAAKSEQETLRKKHENAVVSRAAQREQKRQKQLDSANRLATASERRRKQLEDWQERKQQEIEEKERLASLRRSEHIRSIRVKSQSHEGRSALAHTKRREQQQRDERDSKDYLCFRNKQIGRLALNCDGLPDAIREEVVESGQGLAVPTPSSRAGRGSRSKEVPPARTPPPTVEQSPRSSPPSAFEPHMAVLGAGWEPAAASAAASGRQIAQLPAFPVSDAAGAVPPAPESSPDAGRCHRPSAKARGQPGSRQAGAASLRARRPGGSRGRSPAVACGEAAAASGDAALKSPSAPSVQLQTTETASAAALQVASQRAEDEDGPARLQAWRRCVDDAALIDEEALRVAREACGSQPKAPWAAAITARISKLAGDFAKVMGLSGAKPPAQAQKSQRLQLDLQSLDLERADAALAELCRALEQSEQEEVDLSFVLQLDCAAVVIDLCVGIRDFVLELFGVGGICVPSNARQLSNLLLSALTWLALLCKQRVPRAFLLLSGRAAALADAAIVCLEAHFASAAGAQLPEASSHTVLFLPQVLHLLSLSVGETLPGAEDAVQPLLVPYLATSGLPHKIRELFRLAEERGSRAFDGPSPVPLLLLRSMTFLETLVTALGPPSGREDTDESHARVLQELCRTELFGVPSLLVSILLSAGSRDRKTQQLPQTIVSLALQAVRILNHIARFDLPTLQNVLGAHSRPELYHLLVCIFEYCNTRLHGVCAVQQPNPDETELLHETITLLGFYCLQRPENQGIMCFGAGQTLLALITSLPLHYFMDERGRCVLFPTILAACFQSERNLELLRNEMTLSLLEDFIAAHIDQCGDSRPCCAAARAFAERFPRALWQDACVFFRDDDL